MLRRPVVLLALALPGLLWRPAVAAEPLAPATEWLPQNALIVLEVSKPGALLDLALDAKTVEAVTSLPPYQQAASQPGFQQFMGVVEFLEFKLKTDWKTALRKLTGGGITLAVVPGNAVLLIVDSDDAKLLNELHETILGFARSDAQNKGQPNRVASADYRGVTGWTFNGDEAHAIIGNRLVAASKPDAIKALLDRNAEPDGQSLASLPAYQAAKKAAGPEAVATAYVNLATLKQAPGVMKVLTSEQNPLAGLLFAGMTEAVVESNWLSLGLSIEGDTLKLAAAVDGQVADPSGAAAFALPSEPGQGAMPNFTVPRMIAGLSFYRDLHGFYAAKDDLFPERTSGLIFFENMMGIFFTGRDLAEEVLSETKPEIRVVVAEQEYDPAVGAPQLQIPAFAMILRLHNPEKFSIVVEEAWQKALGLINFTSGQQALPGLIIDKRTQGDTKFSVASYSTTGLDESQKRHTRHNFSPSLAMLEDYLIISSAEALTRNLIDAIKKEVADAVKPLAEVHSLAEVDVRQLAGILGANREGMVRNNMVEEGKTKEEAEAG
ncbi:MAG: hypothetical protein ABIK89_07355, partial [Planctomycetota bacterium]